MKLTTQRGRPARQVDESSNADRAVSSLRARWVPFAGPIAVGMVGPLTFGYVLRLSIGPWHNPAALALTASGLVILTAMLGLAVFHGIGSRRRLFVRWHATATVLLAGVGTFVTVAIGIPHGWVIAHLIVGLFAGGSWSLYRVDALRHDPGLDKDERDTWGAALGLDKSHPGEPEVHDARVEIPVKHGPGDTRATIEGALQGVASAVGAVPGRSRVVGGAHAGESRMIIVTRDTLAEMTPWAGPSAVGESIVKPIVVGMREDGRPGQMWLPGDPAMMRPLSHVLHAGRPGFGKTFGARTDFADAITRRDCAGIWLDTTKGAQGSAGIRRGCAGYVTDKATVKSLIRALEGLVRARADVMGRAGHAEWTERTFIELGLPLLVVHCEEADAYINTAAFLFLVNKARSVGLVVNASMQRLDSGSINTTSRAAMLSAFCYAVDNDYSAAMVLSESTLKSGIDPVELCQLPAGYFYLEAPGIPGSEWSLLHRRFSYDPDHMAREVDGWVASGEQAALSTVDIKALSEPLWDAIRGDRADTFGVVTAPGSAGKAMDVAPISAEVVPTDDDADDEDNDDEGDLPTVPANPDPDAAGVDGREPIKPLRGEDVDITDPLPEARTPEEAARAFDDMLRDLVAKGRERVTAVQLAEEYPFRSRKWMHDRLKAVIAGAIVVPDGIVLERDELRASEYVITVLDSAT